MTYDQQFEESKKKIIQVQVFEDGTLFSASCSDLSVFTQGKTLNELAYNIREAVALAVESEDMAELGYVDAPLILANIELGQVQTKTID